MVKRSVDTLQPRVRDSDARRVTTPDHCNPQSSTQCCLGISCALKKQPVGWPRSRRCPGRFWGGRPAPCTSDPSGPSSAVLPGLFLDRDTCLPAPDRAAAQLWFTRPQLGPRPSPAFLRREAREASGWHTRQPALRDWRAERVSPPTASSHKVALGPHGTTRASVPRAAYGRGHGGNCRLHCTRGSVPCLQPPARATSTVKNSLSPHVPFGWT